MFVNFHQKHCWDLNCAILKLWINLGSTDIFRALSLPFHEHGIFLYQVLLLHLSVMFYSFSIKVLRIFCEIALKHIFFVVAIVNGYLEAVCSLWLVYINELIFMHLSFAQPLCQTHNSNIFLQILLDFQYIHIIYEKW